MLDQAYVPPVAPPAFLAAAELRETATTNASARRSVLGILVRADNYWVHPLLVAIAMSAKFTIRIRGKHLYNPANLAVILAIAVVPGALASPGQWGSDVLIGLWFVALGITVTTSARRLDIAWAFLACYTGLLVARMLILGQSERVLIHQLGSGVLLLFTFFMISDPMTTPNRRSMRFVYAALVALLAFAWQYFLFKPHGLVWALFILTPLVPLIDWLLPGRKHAWQAAASPRLGPEPAPSRRGSARKDPVPATS